MKEVHIISFILYNGKVLYDIVPYIRWIIYSFFTSQSAIFYYKIQSVSLTKISPLALDQKILILLIVPIIVL